MSDRYHVPIIDRMIEILQLIEGSEGGQTIQEIVRTTGIPRATTYRILNTLAAHEIVEAHGTPATYVLGPRLLGLATAVPRAETWREFAAAAQPHLRRLSAETGETSKLSVLDRNRALCITFARGTGPFSLNAAAGQHFPLHAGAASKVLLAGLPPAERRSVLSQALPTFTPNTITSRAALEHELAAVADQGWAEDRGEHTAGVRAVGAPVYRSGTLVGALSVAFLFEQPPERVVQIRMSAIAAAAEFSGSLDAAARADPLRRRAV